MYLPLEELESHIRQQHMSAIFQNDPTIAIAAIDTAIAEARGYLGKYDRDHIFSCKGKERNELLLTFVKDMAVYHLINLVNPGVQYDKKEKRYDRAVDWLKAVQKGNVTPDLPLATNESGEAIFRDTYINSNSKRENHF